MTTTDDALAAMVASTKARKDEAASKLTPVVGELERLAAPPADDRDEPETPAPPAVTEKQLRDILLAIEDSRSSAMGYHDRLTRTVQTILSGLTTEPPPALDEGAALAAAGVDIVAAAKRVFPDATFVEDFAAKSKAAQAATFAQSGSPVPGWECSIHGAESIAERKTLKGTSFRACTACQEREPIK